VLTLVSPAAGGDLSGDRWHRRRARACIINKERDQSADPTKGKFGTYNTAYGDDIHLTDHA
jgi:hypothetical protein